MKSDTRDKILRALALAVWTAVIVYAVVHRREITLENILDYTPQNPLLAAAVMLCFFALKSLTVVVYSGLLYIADSVLFPLPVAILLSICGTVVMALIPYLLARSVGAARADELRARYPRLRSFEARRGGSGLAFAIFLRTINIVNFDIGSMYMGAIRLPLPAFLLGSVAGKLVDIILLSVMGASFEEGRSSLFWIALGIDLMISVLTVLVMKKRAPGNGGGNKSGKTA